MAQRWRSARVAWHSSQLPVAQADEVPGVEREQRERDHLQRGEARREAHVERPLAGEVPVVPGPDDPAGQVEDGVEVDDAGGGAGRDQPEDHEHHRDEHGGEQLEEALHPQVDDPEAPVVDHGEVGAGAVEERGQVEERDRRRRVEEQRGRARTRGGSRIAGRRARYMRTSQPASPTASSSCQKRPRSRYSEPWWPNQNQRLPRRSLMPSHSPPRLPKTTTARAASSARTPARCPRGSAPPTIGARKRPPATQAVAIQKMASWRWKVRSRL